MGLFSPEIMLKVMENTSSIAHARSGQNQAGAFVILDLHGLLGSSRSSERHERVAQRALGNESRHVVIEHFAMLCVNPCGLDRHGTI